MAAVTICTDFGAQKNYICHCFHFFPIYLSWSDGTWCHDVCFLNLSFKSAFHSPLSPSSRVSIVLLCFLPLGWYHLHIWGCCYFSWQSWFQLVLHPAWHFAWCTLQGDNIQALMYSFPNLEPVCCSMSSSNCCFQICIQICQEASQMVWYFHLLKNFPQFVVIHTVKGFGIATQLDKDQGHHHHWGSLL